MADAQKKIFLSYRRSLAAWVARSVYQHLGSVGYDVFMDVESLDNGEFSSVILHQIEARPHFLIVLTPGSLVRTVHGEDWLRREIEHALGTKRNIVPLLAESFTFDSEQQRLQGKQYPPKIRELAGRNGINVPNDLFTEAMTKLMDRFLKSPVKAAITPTPPEEERVVRRMSLNAASAKLEPVGRNWIWSIQTPLDAPKLKKLTGSGWGWTPVLAATGYVLQKSDSPAFENPIEVYNGEETTCNPRLEMTSFSLTFAAFGVPRNDYYRVKAKGEFGFSDSPWSDVVKDDPPVKVASTAAVPFRGLALETPVLERQGSGWKWTEILGATGYLLQSSANESFAVPVEVYAGPDREYPRRRRSPFDGLDRDTPWSTPRSTSDPDPAKPFGLASEFRLPLKARPTYYRVRAKGSFAFLDSPWSNVMTGWSE